MRNGVVAEIPTKNHEVIATYFKSYIPFAQELPMSQRIKDRALFAYGRFLKNGYSKK
jgi:hypothetical protein